MGYCTRDELIDRVGGAVRAAKLTTETGDAPDDEQIDTLVAAVSRRIDSYLAKRYAVPIDTVTHADVGQLLKGAALDLGAWELHKLRPPVPEDVTGARDRTVAWLQELRAGKADLPAATALDSPTAGGIGAEVHGPERVFGRGKLSGL